MTKPKKRRITKATVRSAVEGAFSIFTELLEEIGSVVDDASGTNRENTDRIQRLMDVRDTLSELNEPDVPEWLDGVDADYQEVLSRSKRQGLSRADRRDNACSALDAAISAIQGFADHPPEVEGLDEDDIDISACTSLIDDLENAKSEVEGIEFPGWTG